MTTSDSGSGGTTVLDPRWTYVGSGCWRAFSSCMPAKPKSLHVDALTFVNTKRRRTLPAAPVDCGCASPSCASRHLGTLAVEPAACASAAPAAPIAATTTITAPSRAARRLHTFMFASLVGRRTPALPGYGAAGHGPVTIRHRLRQLRRHE